MMKDKMHKYYSRLLRQKKEDREKKPASGITKQRAKSIAGKLSTSTRMTWDEK
jgi:hypothetical protein